MDTKTKHDIQIIWELTRDYKNIVAWRFFATLIHCALLGWGGFLISIYFNGIIALLAYVIGLIFIYKGTLMIHEVAHFQKKVKGLRLTYNLLFGFFNKYPAYLYDTHPFHHGKQTFSTYKDPEYQYVRPDTFLTIIGPIFVSLFLPIFQILRFVILPPLLLIAPYSLKKKVYTHFSTLVFDVKYKRIPKNKTDINQMLRNDLATSFSNWIFIYLIYLGQIPSKALALWYGMIVFASMLNMYRAKYNHVYNNKERTALSWEAHLLDCLTIDKGIITEIISPVGLRYHALHHVMQEIPFYNLKRAHEYLLLKLPADHIYRQTVVANFWMAIKKRNELAV